MPKFTEDSRYNIAPRPAEIKTAPWRRGDPYEPEAVMFVPIDPDSGLWVTDFTGYKVRVRLDYEGEGGDAVFLLEDQAEVGGVQGAHLTAVEGDYLNTKRNQTIHGLNWRLALPSSLTETFEHSALCLAVQFQASGSPNWKTAFIYRSPPSYGC